MTSRATGSPYGPMTPTIRAFLVRFAGLGATDRAQIVAAFAAQCVTRAWSDADRALGDTIERSGRTEERDALAGPLLQLARLDDAAEHGTDDVPLDPVAEPALAALMALLVRDLLSPHHVATLYAPFAETIPLGEQPS